MKRHHIVCVTANLYFHNVQCLEMAIMVFLMLHEL